MSWNGAVQIPGMSCELAGVLPYGVHAGCSRDSAPTSVSAQAQECALCSFPQERIAVNKEVMAAVSNGALITPDGKFGM